MNTEIQQSTDETNPPLSVTERRVAELWSEVLQTTDLPNAVDNFFGLGGDSMAMVMLEYRIKEEFTVELPAGAVLGAPTLRELAALVDATTQGSHKVDTRP
jgi:acyl carrier protein